MKTSITSAMRLFEGLLTQFERDPKLEIATSDGIGIRSIARRLEDKHWAGDHEETRKKIRVEVDIDE